MQLKHRKFKKAKARTGTRITGALASATCALLGSPALLAAETPVDQGWKIDTAYLSYTEKDRVTANEPMVKAEKTFADSSKLGLKVVLDTLTGASPSGAAPGSTLQTFTRPSGSGQYTVQPGDIPLDDTFKDTRTQLGASWDAPINRLWRYNVGFNTSTEHDYQSISANGGFSYDFNKKNNTLSVNLSYAADTVKPEGGIPKALSTMNIAGTPTNRDGSDDTKNVADILVGLTQVVNASTIMQFNLGVSQSSGYLNDPYKVLSIVDATTGEPVTVAAGGVIYENRPDTRLKESLFWETKHHTNWGDTIDVSYRYMTDDWGVNSHTVDFKYRWNATDNFYVQPHVRWYTQTAADFYRHNLTSTPLPGQEMSADYRLAEFDATTLGVKFGYTFSNKSELNLRVENYQQTGNVSGSEIIGAQNRYDTYPDLDAMIMQVGYSFKF